MDQMMHRLSMGKKIGAICSLFILPMAVSLYMIVTGYSQNLNVARLELAGNAYQRPLMRLLKQIPIHGALVERHVVGIKESGNQLGEMQEAIDQALEALREADRKFGADLQFTEEGLAKRKREHYRFETIRREWEDPKLRWNTLSPKEIDNRHTHLLADV